MTDWEWTHNPDGSWSAYSQRTHWHWHVVPYKPDQYPDSWTLKGRHWTWGEDEWRWFGGYAGLDNVRSWAQREDSRPSNHPLFRLYKPSDRDEDEDEPW